MEDDAAQELDVEVSEAEAAPCDLPDDGEGLGEDVVQGIAVPEAGAELVGLRPELGIGEALYLRLQAVDGLHQGPELAQLALVLVAQDPAHQA